MNKISKNIIIAAIVAIVAFIAWYFSNIVAYVLVSAVLALLAKAPVDFLSKLTIKGKRLPRWICATAGLLLIWAAAYFFLIFFIPLIGEQAQKFAEVDTNKLVQLLTKPFENIEEFVNSTFPDAKFSMTATAYNYISSILKNTSIVDSFGSITNFLISMLMAVFAVSFITFFFLKEESLFIDGIVVLFPLKFEPGIRNAWRSSTNLLMRYFLGVTLDMCCVLIVLTLGLKFFAGLDFTTALLIGFIAGILNVIPYVGPIISCGLGLIIAVASNIHLMGSPELSNIVIKLLIVFVAMKVLDDTVFQPYIFANSVKAHPLEIFLLILVAGSVAGIGGMLLAIPAYTVLRVFAKEFLNNFRIVQKLTERI